MENGREQRPRAGRRALRETLMAAVTAATLVNAEAPAIGADTSAQTPSAARADTSSKKVPQLKQEPKRARRIVRTPAPEDIASMDKYFSFADRMNGAHLVGNGAVVHQWQYEEFCKELEDICKKFSDSRPDIEYDHEFSPKLWAILDGINRTVNTRVRPVTDMELYGVVEKWTVPDDAGDCEDYVLGKMVELLKAGLDPAYLHILIVDDERGNGHAVLGVDVFKRGQRNTLILDNIANEVITLIEMEAKYAGKRASFLSHTGNRENLRVRFYEYRSRK